MCVARSIGSYKARISELPEAIFFDAFVHFLLYYEGDI